MKKIFFLLAICMISLAVTGQEFNTQLASARTAYKAGKLDESRFAMEQMLQEIDMMVGKEVLKILPAKLEDKAAISGSDNVSGASGFFGVVIHREYGTPEKNISIEIISNSPLVTSLNAMLSLPLIGGAGGDSKVIRISGYKALLNKVSGENEKDDFEIQLPLNTALITLRAPGYTQDQVVKIANTLPVAQIAKMIQ
jgi:hypothetical protein